MTATVLWGGVVIALYVVHAIVGIHVVAWMLVAAVQWLTLVWVVAALTSSS